MVPAVVAGRPCKRPLQRSWCQIEGTPLPLRVAGFHFNTAAVVVASRAAPASLSTGDQQMLIRKINNRREGVDIFGAVRRQSPEAGQRQDWSQALAS